MVKKMPSWDAYGGDDDDSDCLSRLLEDVQSVHVVSSYFAHVLTHRGIYSREAFISLSTSNSVAFIREWRLFTDIRYVATAITITFTFTVRSAIIR